MIELNGIRLRNRVVTSSSLLGYGAKARSSFLPYGMSPIAEFVPLRLFGAVTVRTLTLKPRDGHFTLRTDWKLREWPGLARRYRRALRRADSGWINAFSWCNVGIEAYFADYYPRTRELNLILSIGGFSAGEFCELVDWVNRHASPGDIAGVEFNLSSPNANFRFEEIMGEVLERAVPRSRHPVLLKISADSDYLKVARMAKQLGVRALTAINTVRGLRLEPETGEALLENGFGGLSGRCIKPIGVRVVNELRQAVDLPIIASGGIRTFDDCREYFWAGADAVSLGSEIWLAPWWSYGLAPLHAWRIRSLVERVRHHEIPERAVIPSPAAVPTTATSRAPLR